MGSDRYVLLERIGVGGMAEVFRASVRGAEGFERPIAIKRILPELSQDTDFVRMFVDEAKIAVQLQHPNIVQIFDLGREGREYFIAMELVHGKDLRAIQVRARQAGARLPLAVSLHIVMKVCEALHHAHCAVSHHGRPLCVVHRDVTPQNVLVSYDGEVKVTDFGLAKAVGRATETRAGVVKGKLAYMAPESFTGMGVDHRSDVFGAGILLWEMLSGRRLFVGANDMETVEKARLAIVPSLRAIDPSIPPEVERIVRTALARDREHRYPTAEAFHEELEAFAYGNQEFLTTASLASWLREWFPPPPPAIAPRGRDVATREIRLDEVGAPSRERAPETIPPDALIEDDSDVEPIGDEDMREMLDTMPPVDALDEPQVPRHVADAFDDTTGPRADAFDDVTGRLVPSFPDPFDDTTGKMMPAIADALVTEMRYDRELVQTVPHARITSTREPTDLGATPLDPAPAAAPGTQPLSWDDDEDKTVVGPRDDE
ncbi:serine/threonine-protein kinase [Sandaracinus amylolyticus]|uniref:serine/threonine-protein kinase n=1 Tax=Sandaracinus amylolyticus TaxID=927083 RepID=UPI001F173282|nr:serine/threonine-protein kinase [Sandaracinus amylolyticus]UJR81227.1 Serine/threonine protein kinase PrkC, regulator of stationary phase [Sandaracinus amylolyticus]